MIHGFDKHFAVLKHKIVCLHLKMNKSSQPCTKNQSTNLQVKQVIGLQSAGAQSRTFFWSKLEPFFMIIFQCFVCGKIFEIDRLTSNTLFF